MPENPPRRFSLSHRAAGVLLHPTSLPGPYGCGDLGESSRAFVRLLSRGRQRWWQMLPVGTIGPGDSPYAAYSAFAGCPLLIDLENLRKRGWLTRAELRAPARLSGRRVDYAATRRFRERALRLAFERYLTRAGRPEMAALDSFRASQSWWLEDCALFFALKEAHAGAAWTSWPKALAQRQPAALERARRDLDHEVLYHVFVQHLFHEQWRALRAFAHRMGVGLIGDVPIFVTHDSADVWANRALFRLDSKGKPTVVSGTPPDNFSKTGQLWGHPLYDWNEHLRTGFAWWVARFDAVFQMFDAVRIDHFLGFYRCWVVPGRAKVASGGKYELSPGRELFQRVREELRDLEIVAEDLGTTTPEALALREELGFPGMRVLQNGFYDGSRYDQPHNYPRGCAAYTGTHDNDTIVGWFKAARSDRGADGLTTAARTLRYVGGTAKSIHENMIRALYQSPADVVVTPAQDVLGLGSAARMNTPATCEGNWGWRLASGQFTPRHADWLAANVETYQRGDAPK
ncbi:MAG: 4-alpha-glucanotransferase [Phycisphaerales bacterium]|nr:4-alpha-glucanotransferase [Phycisphaerales bacterium]